MKIRKNTSRWFYFDLLDIKGNLNSKFIHEKEVLSEIEKGINNKLAITIWEVNLTDVKSNIISLDSKHYHIGDIDLDGEYDDSNIKNEIHLVKNHLLKKEQ